MTSKTPKFDSALNKVLETLVPHARKCKWQGVHKYCEGEFNLEETDIKLLKILRVPPPNFCPTCRRMRRLPYMAMSHLFKIKCDVPGHNEMMISILPEECPFPVYDYKYFIGDEFDALSFGIEYKKGDSPLETLFDLRKKFPMPSFLNRDPSSINSDYSNGGRNTKNVYYAFGCYNAEDVWYSAMLHRVRNVMDSMILDDSEFIYEGASSNHIYKSSFFIFSNNCLESMFLFDCRNCQNCFGCVNLRNSKYCIWNEQYSKEDYEKFIASIYPLSHDDLVTYEEKFWKLVRSLPMNGTRNIASTNVSGVNIKNSRNLYNVIDANGSENVRHADAAINHKDSMDFLFSGGHASSLYMTTNVGSQSSNIRFSASSKYCVDCDFVFNSKNLTNCFMCFGLQNKSYCILNKQYEKDEYFRMLDEIKLEMLGRGEYSDGVGLNFCAQAYNVSLAQNGYPLSEEEVKKIGGYTAKDPETNVGNTEIVKYSDLPKTINEITDDIVSKAILCEKSGKPFRITQSELEFYRRTGLPLPNIHPLLRMRRRLNLVKTGKKYKAVCVKCNKEIETVLNPSENFIFYCDKCYQQEVF